MVSESWNVVAREITFAEAKRAASSLADCFANDRVARYYLQVSDCNLPLTPKKAELNLRIYECLTAAHCDTGLVVSAGPCYDSVGLWLPPGSDWNWRTYWRSGLWRLWLRLGREGRSRFFGSWDILEESMIRTMGRRSSITWVLTDLGTRKSSRRQGLATKVMEYGLALADAQCQPTYLECFDYNVSFYKKFGFQTQSTLSLNHDQEQIVLQAMVREPRMP
ncbi:putative n-acetyltransferase-like protein [Penicillium brasilianum]|uniref:Putative n-acetyltransferase-like protein n=1 Tax=Penicillium brasilianum TaxID=104259 RepID=A0A1S9RL63_PENBI|nr:putative n-acetyltransferase-like protein [Penicillium brasilianum]